jgi:hypothetical protein
MSGGGTGLMSGGGLSMRIRRTMNVRHDGCSIMKTSTATSLPVLSG